MRAFIGILFCLLFTYLSAQEIQVPVDTTTKKVNIVAFPIVFYLPQTSLGLGVGGITTFRLKNEPLISRPSSVQFGAAYTFNKQLLLYLPFEIYKNNEKWKIFGEIGYYAYFYYFYGKGSRTLLENQETYDVVYPRFRLDVLKRFRQHYFVGFNYWFDNFNIKSVENGGLLDQQRFTGVKGGPVSGIGVTLQYDSRNYLFHPSKGAFVDYRLRQFHSVIGSSYNYTRSFLNINYYKGFDDLDVLAFNITTQNMFGDVPFFDYAYVGSPQTLRGYNDRRFTDENLVAFQVEYRKNIWRRVGGVIGLSTGTVYSKFNELPKSALLSSAVIGARYMLSRKERLRIRLDYGITTEGGNVYLTVNEAF